MLVIFLIRSALRKVVRITLPWTDGEAGDETGSGVWLIRQAIGKHRY